MARTSNITFGQVAAIADAMKAAGTRPTARAVRERIGSGSMGTIHKLLQQWTGKASAEDEETEAAELPTHIQNALMDFIGTEIATACEPINEELQAARAELDAVALENERIWRDLGQAGDDLEQCRQDRAAAVAQLNETREHLKNANKAREALGEANTALLRDLDRAQRQIEMLASYAPDLAKAQTALAESEERRQRAETSEAVLAAKLEARTDLANSLSDQLQTVEQRLENREGELRQANNHYQACAARLEAAAREIESLRKPKAAPAKAPKAKPATVKKPDGNS